MNVPNKDFLGANQRDRELFLRELISELASTLQDVVGMTEAEGFVKMVGLKVGEAINADYVSSGRPQKWTVEHLAGALVDLKRKIDGGFKVESYSEKEIVLINDRCPFGDLVLGRPALCQMTSSVFGKISSEHFDYARVEIDKAIAHGDGHCRIVVHLEEPVGEALGVEFYKT